MYADDTSIFFEEKNEATIQIKFELIFIQSLVKTKYNNVSFNGVTIDLVKDKKNTQAYGLIRIGTGPHV